MHEIRARKKKSWRAYSVLTSEHEDCSVDVHQGGDSRAASSPSVEHRGLRAALRFLQQVGGMRLDYCDYPGRISSDALANVRLAWEGFVSQHVSESMRSEFLTLPRCDGVPLQDALEFSLDLDAYRSHVLELIASKFRSHRGRNFTTLLDKYAASSFVRRVGLNRLFLSVLHHQLWDYSGLDTLWSDVLDWVSRDLTYRLDSFPAGPLLNYLVTTSDPFANKWMQTLLDFINKVGYYAV